MGTYVPSDSLVAAVLSDFVYHTGNESIVSPPLPWVKIDAYYDHVTGYYGEAWGKLPLDANGNPELGQPYTEIMQVNRGTVFTASGSGAPVNVAFPTNDSTNYTLPEAYLNSYPGAVSGSNALSDSSSTVGADESIAFGSEPSYISKSADGFYQILRNSYPSLPIIEVGQSLGGATSDGVVVDHPDDNNLSAITFNALPYGEGIPGLSDATASRLATLPSSAEPGLAVITNYYVGNEIATQAQIVQGTLQLFGGKPIGNTVNLPDLPDVLDPSNYYTGLLAPIVVIHDAPAGVSQLFQALYTPSSPDYNAALQWLRQIYPVPTSPAAIVPPQVQAVLTGGTVPADADAETIIPNLDNSITLLTGNIDNPQQIETVFRSQVAAGDTYTVQQLPLTENDEATAWETDAYNASSQLIGITQTKIYTDGSIANYLYNPNRVLQSIDRTPASGGPSVQTYSADGTSMHTVVTITEQNKIEVQQYQGDPVLVADYTSDLGTGVVAEIAEQPDGSVLTEVNYDGTTTDPGTYLGIVANSDGTTDLVDGQGEDGTGGHLIDFGVAGLADDQLSVALTENGDIVATTDIEPGTPTIVASDENQSTVQEDFAFTATSETLEIAAPSSFIGTISGVTPGDMIDLAGIGTATGATLGADNALEVDEANGAITLSLDPSQNYTGDGVIVTPDGNGGTDLTLQPEIPVPEGQTVSPSQAAGGSGATIAFGGNSGTIIIPDTQTFNDTITNFQAGDIIQLPNLRSPFPTLIVDTNDKALLIENYPSPSYNQSFEIKLGSFDNYEDQYGVINPQNYDFLLQQSGANYVITTTEQLQSPACYCRGTRVLTVVGEIPVEQLQIGNLVATFAGKGAVLKPVKWLGYRRIDLRQHLQPENIHPVRFLAGSLGDGIPHRDLLVSPNHRMCIDGTLVTALELVNGATIVQESPNEVEYWHIELVGHDLVLAEGVQAETYQDVGNRSAFENAEVVALHPVLDGDVPEPCLPYAGVSAAARERFIAQAEAMGWTRCIDPMPWLEVDGQRIEPVRRGEFYQFIVPVGCSTARLRSRAGRPWDVDPHSGDRRHLGLKLHHLALGNARSMRKVPLDSAALKEGFDRVESDETGWTWRWTDGDALLSLADLAPRRKITVVEIAYNQALPMWVKDSQEEDVLLRDGRLHAGRATP